MTEKRYAIVRVDKLGRNFSPCPAGFEEIDNDFVCSYKKSKALNSIITNCQKCRYGDTKEQLIRKVAQAIKSNYDNFLTVDAPLAVILDIITGSYKDLAKEIVEFLGVE